MTSFLKPNRRGVLMGVAALTLPNFASAQDSWTTLAPQKASMQILPDSYPTTEIWGYGGTSPGPQIRVRQGQRVQRR